MNTASLHLGGLDLDELRAFLAVADTGSFCSAARVLDVPRSTLLRRVNSLVARVGSRLLVRSPVGAKLTGPGSVLRDGGARHPG